ncbi:hypothetical protein ACO1O0_002602 [Amphichorda felina]
MQLPTVTAVVLPLFFAATANAWGLTVYFAGPGHISTHGTTNSGCVNFDIDTAGKKVNKAKFTDSFYADTFELYTKKNCKGKVSYRNGDGTHKMSARKIRSYKVY